MGPFRQLLYAAGLATWLIPAAFSRLRRNGIGSLRPREFLALDVLSPAGARPLWVHAVSVGELNAANQLLIALGELGCDPPVLLTCTTETARRHAAERLGVKARALPLDFATVMGKFVDKAQPIACVLLEQELWPNLTAACADRGVRVAVANGRMSARSARRHARCRSFTGGCFRQLAGVAAQTRADACRFRALGVTRTVVTGNLKHDAVPDAALVARGKELGARLRRAHPGRQVILAASTRRGEERLLFPALREVCPGALLIAVPRHPERFAEVGRLLAEAGYALRRMSELQDGEAPECLLGDTMGEMAAYIAAADTVFVGGSLLPYGGQNVMEPLALGKPVVTGPHTENIAALVNEGVRAGAVGKAHDASEAARMLTGLAERSAAAAAGRAAAQITAAHRGAARRTAQEIIAMLGIGGG